MIDEQYYTIGEVLNLLKVEYPDLTLSRIRTLERKGHIKPERTPSGYRKFGDVDVELLRTVLKSHPDKSGNVQPQEHAAASVSMTLDELADAVGADRRFIVELARLGFIEPIDTKAGAVYDDHSLVVARTATRLQSHGLDARHLRMYKVSSDREAGVLLQLFGAKLARSGPKRDEARSELTVVIGLGESLRRALLKRDLGE